MALMLPDPPTTWPTESTKERPARVARPGLDQEHGGRGVGRETVGEDAAGGAGADDDVVVAGPQIRPAPFLVLGRRGRAVDPGRGDAGRGPGLEERVEEGPAVDPPGVGRRHKGVEELALAVLVHDASSLLVAVICRSPPWCDAGEGLLASLH